LAETGGRIVDKLDGELYGAEVLLSQTREAMLAKARAAIERLTPAPHPEPASETLTCEDDPVTVNTPTGPRFKR